MRTCAIGLMVVGLAGGGRAAVIPNADFELSVPGNGWSAFDYYGPVTVSWEGDATNHYARIEPGSGYPTNVGMASDYFAAGPMIDNLGYDFSIDAAFPWGASWQVGYEWYVPGTSPLQSGWGTFSSGSGASGWTHYTAHLASLPPDAQLRVIATANSWGRLEIDNVEFMATPIPLVQGTVVFSGFVGDNTTQVRFTLTAVTDGRNATRVVNVDADGSFSLDNIVPGTYDITVSSTFCLTTVLANVPILTDPAVLAPVLLRTGDSNGDNQVNFEDFSILQNNYRQTGDDRLAAAAALDGTSTACGSLAIISISILGLALVGADRT